MSRKLGQPAFSRVLTDMADTVPRPARGSRQERPGRFDQLSNLLNRDMRGPADDIQIDIAALRIGQRYDIFLGGQLAIWAMAR